MDLIEHYRQVDFSLWDVLSKVEDTVRTKVALLHVFGKDANKAFVVTSDDEVFSVGINNLGCLGIGETDRSEQLIKMEGLCHKNVIQFSATDNCAMALTRSGKVYYWGGYSTQKEHTGPGGMEKGVGGGGGGGMYNSFGGERGAVGYVEDDYASGGYGGGGGGGGGQRWGRKRGGSLRGPPPEMLTVTVYWGKYPLLLELPKNVSVKPVQVQCLDSGFAFLSSDNQVFEWGKLNSGEEIKHPKLVSFPPGVVPVYITSGGTFTVAITKCNRVFAWGSFVSGPFVTSGFSRSQPRCAMYLDDLKVIKACCHGGNSVFLTENGTVYTYVQGSKSLEKLNIENVKNIEGSPMCNLFAAVTSKGVTYIWGREGQLDYPEPVKSKYHNIQEVFASFGTPSVFRAKTVKRKLEEDEEIEDEKDHPNAALFNTEDHSNVTVVIKEEKVFVNKAILIKGCAHFKTVLQGVTANRLDIEDYSIEVYKAFLKYIYTGILDRLTGFQCIELLKLADTYKQETLKQKCMDLFKENLTDENSVELFSKCNEVQSKDLEEICAIFIEKGLKENPLSSPVFHNLANDLGRNVASTLKRLKDAAA